MPDTPDVQRLMAELEARVAAKKAAGLYSVDALAAPAPHDGEPLNVDDLVEVAKLAELEIDLQVARSTKRHVGKAVTQMKGGLVRATSQPLQDLADRGTAFNLALLSYVTVLSQEVARLTNELEGLKSQRDDRPSPS